MNVENTKNLSNLLAVPQRIVLIPHRNPDGDAIGSCLGLSGYLKALGQEVQVLAPNDFPEFLKWMPDAENVVFYESNTRRGDELIQNATLIFTLDFNALNRTGIMEQQLAKATCPMVLIDHHPEPDAYAQISYSDTGASSTCELVFNTIVALEGHHLITPGIASCLYAGIMTDTGSFKYPSTSPNTLRAAASLMEMGADHSKIHTLVYDASSPQRIQLLGKALSNLHINSELRTAFITLSQEDLDSCNFQKGDTEGFVNYGLSIKNIVFAVIFIEHRSEGIVKISLRSRGSFDVNSLARTHFEGGGHRNAAGGKSNASLEETVTRFTALLPSLKAELLNA
jgi:bifunctional oligoribonuclease and PAP phosphatase NrnA